MGAVQVYVLKQHYDPAWGADWRRHFHTDAINGALGHELKFNGQPLIASYMRVRIPAVAPLPPPSSRPSFRAAIFIDGFSFPAFITWFSVAVWIGVSDGWG